MSMTRLLALVVGVFAPALPGQAAPAAQSNAFIEPITGLPLPVDEGETVVRFKDGCGVIVSSPASLESQKTAQAREWLGACRFGLIDGTGFYRQKGANPEISGPVTLRLGRPDKQATESDRTVYTRNSNRGTELSLEIYNTPQEARAAARRGIGALLPESALGGRDWSAVLARVLQRSSQVDENFQISISYLPCPGLLLRPGVAEQMTKIGFSAEKTRVLAPFCEAAYARLKRERGVAPNKWLPWGTSDPFKDLDYGYYYEIQVVRSTAGKSTDQATICSRPDDVSSCDPLWRPLVAPYIPIRDAERKREAENDARRAEMMSRIESAFQVKLEQLMASKARGNSR